MLINIFIVYNISKESSQSCYLLKLLTLLNLHEDGHPYNKHKIKDAILTVEEICLVNHQGWSRS